MTDHAIILAAGASERMGRPKQLLELDGIPLLTRMVRMARDVGAEPLVVLGAHSDAVTPSADGARSLYNPNWSDGMGSSLALGAAALPQRASRALVLAIDQPDVDPALLEALLDACDSDHDASATRYEDGRLGVPACFGPSMFDELRDAHGDAGARRFLRSADYEVAAVPARSREVDVDTPGDWRAYLESRTSNRGGAT